MKTLTIILGANLFLSSSLFGQCTANYSYNSNNDTLTFTNLSTISNAHFYWNFGDGSGSNDISPTHVFPDDGSYLVTLYGLDTISNCVDIEENWINVIKPDTFACNIFFTDTIIGTSPQTTNLSTNCAGYNLNCHVFANAQNICNGFVCSGWDPALFLHGMQAARNDSIYGYRIFHAYYETFPIGYSSSVNYGNCSSNFEVLINYLANGALVTFTAMNKSGTSTFAITGFGNPIYLSGYSVSYLYPYYSYRKVSPHLVTHTKSDPSNGCSSVSSTQCILNINPYYTWPANCVITQQPQAQYVLQGSMAQFIIDAPNNVTKQWQQDSGLGFVNLTNAGPYSGVNTDTLSITNVQLTMNNYNYRCILADSSGNGCHNTSSTAVLYITTTGISELFHFELHIFPNPVTNMLKISVPFKLNTASIKIFNVLGEDIYSSKLENDQEVDVKFLNPGIYFLELKHNNLVGRSRFIKN